MVGFYDSARKFRNKFVVATREFTETKKVGNREFQQKERNRKTSGRERRGRWLGKYGIFL